MKPKQLLLFALLTLPLVMVAQDRTQEYKDKAETLFRAVYEGKLSHIDALASDSIVASYPVFQKVFQTNALRGKMAYQKFAAGFNTKWKDGKVAIYSRIADGDQVVLVWSYSAKRIPENKSETAQEHSWGGITLFRFDTSGRIVEEVGEESTPGPMARLN